MFRIMGFQCFKTQLIVPALFYDHEHQAKKKSSFWLKKTALLILLNGSF